MTAERIQMEAKQADSEEELKAAIKALEKRITNKQSYIDKLLTEATSLKFELFELKQKRIKLLQRELEDSDQAVSEGLKSVTS